MKASQGSYAAAEAPDVRLQSALPRDFWVVIAAYNEAARIGAVLDELDRWAPNIVVVDDGSSDATVEEVLARPVWLLRHPANVGQGAALQTGIRFALERGAGYVATFDADGQHRPADLLSMYQVLVEQQVDFALGSRFLGRAMGIPKGRLVMLRLAVLFTRIVSGVALTDAHNGLRLMSRRGAESIQLTLNRMEHASQFIDQVAASGLPYTEVPVTIQYTTDTLAKGQKTTAAIRLGTKLLLERLCH